MQSKIFQLGQSPRLVFRSCKGDMRIQGWEKDQVELLFRNEADALNARELQDSLEVSAGAPVTANVPVETTAVLESCSGEVRAVNLKELHVNKHRGDLILNRVNKIDIAAMCGDVHVRESQSLHVATLNGDLRVRGATDKVAVVRLLGRVLLKGATAQLDLCDITGDLSIRDPDGQVDVHDVNGDIELEGNLQSGQYNLETSGDVHLYLDPTSHAHLDLEAPLGRVASSLELDGVQEFEHRIAGALGNGTAQVKVLANNGDIKLRQRRVNGLEQQVDTARARTERSARREAERAQRTAEKLRDKSERLQTKARWRSERLAQKAQERAARLRRWHSTLSTPQAHGVEENLEDERQAVLRMLAEGKINSEQAEVLLTALEA